MLDAAATNHLQSEPQLARVQHRQCGSRSSSPHWRVIRSRPQAESWAFDNLTRQGYVAYLPLVAMQVPDRVLPSLLRTVEAPLFRNYLFIRLADTEPTFPIRGTYGVAQLLPGHARNGDIEALQAGDELRRHLPAPNARWAPGTPCGLANGLPLSGLPAVVTELRGHQVHIAVMFLGQLRHIRVHASQLIPREN